MLRPWPRQCMCSQTHSSELQQSRQSVSGPDVFILGDFNTCKISDLLPNLEQYVTCHTHLNKTLDKCYGHIPNAFAAVCRPPLGRSDHKVIHLLPRFFPNNKPWMSKELKTYLNEKKHAFIQGNALKKWKGSLGGE